MSRFLKKVNGLFSVAVGGIFAVIVVIMVRDVIGRYAFNDPFLYSQDIATQLLLLATFLGAGYVVSVRGFPTVDMFYNKFSPAKQAVVDILAYLGGLIFLVILGREVIRMMSEAVLLKTSVQGPSRIPMVVPYGGMLIGLFFFCLQICEHIYLLTVSLIRGRKAAG